MTNLQIGDRVCQVHNTISDDGWPLRAGTIVAQDFEGWDVGVLWDNSSLTLGYKADELGFACHCGRPATYGFDGARTLLTRGMCRDCDAVRCDVDPSACNVTHP